MLYIYIGYNVYNADNVQIWVINVHSVGLFRLVRWFDLYVWGKLLVLEACVLFHLYIVSYTFYIRSYMLS